MRVYHYTTLRNLIEILESGGSFWYSIGYYEPGTKKYYFTDLPPETPSYILLRAIYGSSDNIIHSDATQRRVRGQAYFELNVDGRQIKKTSRLHVFYIRASSPNLFFEIVECGQRTGWQRGKQPARKPWKYGGKLEKYRDAFRKKRRINPKGRFLLQGLKRRI